MTGRKEDVKDKHWSELIAEEVISRKKAPFVISGGMTTSGPAHFGTVCEFLYPYVIKEAMKAGGVDAEYVFVGDILDAFDSVPFELKDYEERLKGELGKPLVHVIDPLGCHRSYGEHYLGQAEEIMKALKIEVRLLKANEMYEKGEFDRFARIYLGREDEVKEVVASSSRKPIESMKDWSPIMPICEKCGKIATTRVLSHSGDAYEYACDRKTAYTQGCGYVGRNSVSDHRYKLQWRLHWPSWQTIFGTSIEGGGVDHMTKGGSWDTAYAIHTKILQNDPPVPFKFGFVLIHGHKYSKSKGIGMSVAEVLRLIPPEMLKYVLVEPNIQQNKDIEADGDSLLLLYGEFERLSSLKAPENRADEKKLKAYSLSTSKRLWEARFVDVLLNFQIYRDWEKVGKILNDPEGVRYLSVYINEWIKRGHMPEKYNFSVSKSKVSENKEALATLTGKLAENMGEVDVHNMIYSVARESGVEPKDFFATLYRALIGKDSGPRLGKLICAIGISRTKEMIDYAIS
jgi:lysyl-tRNA synthetase class 1